MAKNVALSNDAYQILNRLKRSGESFSDVVKRLDGSKNRPNWRDSVGVLNNKDAEIFNKILERRNKIRKRRELKW